MTKKKKEKIIIENLEISDLASEGKAVGKEDGMTIFVPYAVPGDIVQVEIYKKKKKYAEGRILSIQQLSPERKEPICSHFGTCGGCKWQMLDYEKQLLYKRKEVYDNFKHLGGFDFPEPLPTIPSPKQYYYRNKLEFTFTDSRWLDYDDFALQQQENNFNLNGLGFHIPGKFDKVLDIDHCYLQPDPSNNIRLAIRNYAITHKIPFYNLRTHEGVLRNLIIRTSSTGEIMVIIIFKEKREELFSLLDFIAQQFPKITSLQYAINQKVNDSTFDLEMQVYKGNAFIYEKMDDLIFKIGPTSFYQTNSKQAHKLYHITKEFASISSKDIVYDLYTGIGTIANFVAKSAKKVVGIEYIDAAIENAKENALLNQLDNIFFFVGDMSKILTGSFIEMNGIPDIVITDPPRAGMHPAVVQQLINISPKRIVYISCNPATQARDIILLSSFYHILKIQPVDMFPHTHHIENVVLLEKK